MPIREEPNKIDITRLSNLKADREPAVAVAPFVDI